MNRRNALAALFALSLLSSASASASLDSTRPNARPAPGSDEAELWYAMERVELELQHSPLVVRDPALNAYARKVLCEVTRDYCADLRLYLVDLPYFNASMAPNGVMILWTGSLLRIQNEAQLALVLGHEFGHYRERHTLQQCSVVKAGVQAGTLSIGVAVAYRTAVDLRFKLRRAGDELAGRIPVYRKLVDVAFAKDGKPCGLWPILLGQRRHQRDLHLLARLQGVVWKDLTGRLDNCRFE